MTNVKISSNRVTFIVVNEFTDEIETETLVDRYIIHSQNRWSMVYYAMKRYFIDNGQRGCYLGLKRCKDGRYYDIWDLSKIFPNVSFKENDYSNLLK